MSCHASPSETPILSSGCHKARTTATSCKPSAPFWTNHHITAFPSFSVVSSQDATGGISYRRGSAHRALKKYKTCQEDSELEIPELSQNSNGNFSGRWATPSPPALASKQDIARVPIVSLLICCPDIFRAFREKTSVEEIIERQDGLISNNVRQYDRT